MRKPILSIFLVLPFAMSVGHFAVADPENADGDRLGSAVESVKKTMTRVMLTDESFVEKAAVSNLAEVELSHLALNKTKDPAIQQFARQMIGDHTSARQQLTSIAKIKNMVVPTEPDEAHKEVSEKLAKLEGLEFDKEFSKQMQKDHDKAVVLFSAAAEDKNLDVEFKQFAAKILPTLKAHQHAAHALKQGHASR